MTPRSLQISGKNLSMRKETFLGISLTPWNNHNRAEHNTTHGFLNNFLLRPVDIWLRHFIQPFKNSYGWNLYREFWRVWVPLLLAPRFGQFNIRSKQLPCLMLLGMGLVVWTPCQTWRRVGWSRFSSTRWSSSSPARRTCRPSSVSSQSLTLLRQSVDMSSSQEVWYKTYANNFPF